MWTKVGKMKVVKITRKLAEEWRDMVAVPNDRSLSERRMKAYRAAVDRGEFRSVEWAKAYCDETKMTHRVNGKHTSTLFASLDVLPELEASIQEFRCPTLSDLAGLYSTFDTRDQMRSVKDINRSYAGTVPELKDINEQIISTIISGIAYANKPDGVYTNTAAERAEKVLDHVDFAVWTNSLIKEGKEAKKKLCRVPVVAAMFASWEKDRAGAEVFWIAVMDDSGMIQTLPDRELGKWLLTHSIKTSGNLSRGNRAETREFYSMCVQAWNAWREKKERIKLRYHAEDQLPQVL